MSSGAGSGTRSGGALNLHGSAVAVDGRTVLILGASGSGKSALAARMIALGADLVADDRVCVSTSPSNLEGREQLVVAAPEPLYGLLEVRGFGLIRLAALPSAPLRLIADLDQAEPERLPPRRERLLSGIACPVMLCKHKQEIDRSGGDPSDLAAALTCILRAGDRLDPDDPMETSKG